MKYEWGSQALFFIFNFFGSQALERENIQEAVALLSYVKFGSFSPVGCCARWQAASCYYTERFDWH